MNSMFGHAHFEFKSVAMYFDTTTNDFKQMTVFKPSSRHAPGRGVQNSSQLQVAVGVYI